MRKPLLAVGAWTRTHPLRVLFVVLVAAAVTTYAWLVVVPQGFGSWSGFQGKTLWDALDLAGIPLMLGIVAYLFNRSERKADRDIAAKQREADIALADARLKADREIAEKRAEAEREISTDRSQENLLQAYLDRMTELLLEKGLRTSGESSDVRAVARSRTMTVLRRLDRNRKGALLRFLFESKLIDTEVTIVSLRGADLRNANLVRANLPGANLAGANLGRADLRAAELRNADLRDCDLREAYLLETCLNGADLRGAYLRNANLNKADIAGIDLGGAGLRGAKVTAEQLSQVKSLSLATLPDGTKHD